MIGRGPVRPGQMVTVSAERDSFGMIVATINNDIVVLWSVAPEMIVQQINVTSRALKTNWTVAQEETQCVGTFSWVRCENA